MSSGYHLSPESAAEEIRRITRQVGRRARWPGWMFLALAAVNFAYFVIVGSGNRIVSNALIPLPTLLAVAIYLVASRQPVRGRDVARINRPITLAGLVTVVAGLIVYQTAMPQHYTNWLLLLAGLMVLPYLVGAWLWLRP